MFPSVITSRPGPLVHGRQTSLHLMTSEDFVKSPYCQAVISVINPSYLKFQRSFVDSSYIRMIDSDQYAGEIGGVMGCGRPLSSVFVLVFSESWESDPHPLSVIASCATKLSPYHDSAKLLQMLKEKHRSFMRPESICVRVPRTVDWELKLLVTGIEYQKQGIADYLIDICYEEMKRRTAKAERVQRGLEAEDWDTEFVIDAQLQRELQPDRETMRSPKIRVLLTTIEELLRKFYEKRGYTRDASIKFPANTLGGTHAWSVIHMSKTLT